MVGLQLDNSLFPKKGVMSLVIALIRSLEKLQRKTARHAKKAGFYIAVA